MFFQFSLRRLLVAMSLCCLGVGDISFWLRRGQLGNGDSFALVWLAATFSIGAFLGGAGGTLVRRPVAGAGVA
jgi:uncharacterized membrane protein YfcA